MFDLHLLCKEESNKTSLLSSLLSRTDQRNSNTFVRVAIPLILCMKFRATLSATIMLYAVPARNSVKPHSNKDPNDIEHLSVLVYHKLFRSLGPYERNLHPFETTPPILSKRITTVTKKKKNSIAGNEKRKDTVVAPPQEKDQLVETPSPPERCQRPRRPPLPRNVLPPARLAE